jgi:alpha-beta hydrolase superfamily lysophospholipase
MTDPPIAADVPPPAELAEASYFDSGENVLFGWLHARQSPRPGRVGLVTCNPFGYEAICAHRGIRAFAEAAAAIGVPVLRFDYLGTGDSAEIEPWADQIEFWTRDTIAAVREIKRRTGVESVVLLGFRLGALIAMRAAERCPEEIGGLALVSPIISGRRYVKELRTTRLAAMLGAESPEALPDRPLDPQAVTSAGMEISGFSVSAATLGSLARIDFSELSALPVREMLVIDGDTQPVSRPWAESLRGAGANVRYEALPGLVQMLKTAPQFAQNPAAMITAFCDWLKSRDSPVAAGDPSDAPVVAREVAVAARKRMPIVTQLDDPGAPPSTVCEEPLFFGPGSLIFGIITEPQAGEKRRRAVILLNAGADYHVGANGMYVALARRWARRGYVVLRMDFAGIGDSGTLPGHPTDEVFPPGAIDDIRAAVDLVSTRFGTRQISLAGLCSGAYHALRAAVDKLSINRILMINPQNYYWKPGMQITDMQAAEVVRVPSVYRSRAFSLASWVKLFSGQVDLAYISKVLGNRVLLTLESAGRNFARRIRIRLPNDLGWDLMQITARGVKVVLVFARGEPGIELLRIQAGSAVDRLGERCRVHILERGDHVFSKSGPRAALEDLLDDELFAQKSWDESEAPHSALTSES